MIHKNFLGGHPVVWWQYTFWNETKPVFPGSPGCQIIVDSLWYWLIPTPKKLVKLSVYRKQENSCGYVTKISI